MDTPPALSILCSAYRTEAYLGHAIDSVLAQSIPDWELVVVDNGMSDAIRDVVTSYDDARIVFLRQPNAGVDGGYRAAAAAARGRYLLVLSSDDMLTSDAAALYVRMLDEHPRVDAVTGDAFLFDEARGSMRPESWLTHVGRLRRPDPDRPVTFREILGGRDLYSGAVFRRSAWDAVGGFGAGTASDLALWLRLLRDGHEVRELPDKVGIYRLREGSVTRSDRAELHRDTLEQACLDVLGDDDDPGLRRALDRRVRRGRYNLAIRLARGAFLAGDVPEARRQIRVALRQHRTVRAAALAAGLTVAPGALAAVHPLKERLHAVWVRRGAGLMRVEGRSGTPSGRLRRS